MQTCKRLVKKSDRNAIKAIAAQDKFLIYPLVRNII